jgi:GNAT superfamily N-acetyltransferase
MPSRARPARRAGAPGFSLRPAGPRDIDLLVRQRSALFRDLGDLPEAAVRRHARAFRPWLRREMRAGRLVGRIAEDPAGRPIGAGLLWFQPRHPSPRFAQTDQPYVLSVYTAPAARRRGAATAIVLDLIEIARGRGYVRVELHATEMGRPLYEKLGFRPTNQMRLTLAATGDARRSR